VDDVLPPAPRAPVASPAAPVDPVPADPVHPAPEDLPVPRAAATAAVRADPRVATVGVAPAAAPAAPVAVPVDGADPESAEAGRISGDRVAVVGIWKSSSRPR